MSIDVKFIPEYAIKRNSPGGEFLYLIPKQGYRGVIRPKMQFANPLLANSAIKTIKNPKFSKVYNLLIAKSNVLVV